jgi:regulator of replication initiation timing
MSMTMATPNDKASGDLQYPHPPSSTNDTTTPISSPHNDASDQVQALLQAIEIVSKLAALDSHHHRQSLMNPLLLLNHEHSAIALQKQLEALQSTWKFEDTYIPSLVNSIHRLHTAHALMEAEQEHIVTEHAQMRRELEELRLEHQTLRKVAQRLQRQCVHKDREQASLVQQVKEYVRKQQDELDNVYKIHYHEHCLLQGMRQRTMSGDTSYGSLPECKSTVLEDDESDLSLSSTTTSAVPGTTHPDGVATMRFSMEGVVVYDHIDCTSSVPPECQDDTTESPKSHDEYTLVFPAGTSLGLKIRAMAVSDLIKKEKEAKVDAGIITFGTEEEKEEVSSTGTAFVVSGYTKFDHSLQDAPPLGALFVSINGETVLESWTMSQLLEKLGAGGIHRIRGAPPNFERQVTFSNRFVDGIHDTLDPKPDSHLKTAIAFKAGPASFRSIGAALGLDSSAVKKSHEQSPQPIKDPMESTAASSDEAPPGMSIRNLWNPKRTDSSDEPQRPRLNSSGHERKLFLPVDKNFFSMHF